MNLKKKKKKYIYIKKMGYNTQYELEIKNYDNLNITEINKGEIRDKLYEIIVNDINISSPTYELELKLTNDLVVDLIYKGFYNGKWYTYKSDMKKLSSHFSGFVFILYGQGEDNNDIWEACFYNGRGVRYNNITLTHYIIEQYNPELKRLTKEEKQRQIEKIYFDLKNDFITKNIS